MVREASIAFAKQYVVPISIIVALSSMVYTFVTNDATATGDRAILAYRIAALESHAKDAALRVLTVEANLASLSIATRIIQSTRFTDKQGAIISDELRIISHDLVTLKKRVHELSPRGLDSMLYSIRQRLVDVETRVLDLSNTNWAPFE